MRDGVLNRVGKENENYNTEFYCDVWGLVKSGFEPSLAGLKPQNDQDG